MDRLLDFLRRHNYLLLFIVLEYFSLSLLIRFNNYQGSVWCTGANNAVARIDRWYLDLWSYVNLGEVNRELTARNTQLMLENDLLREAMLTLNRDTSEVERAMMRNLVNYEMISAKVISNSKGTKNNYLVIDRGSRHGVREKMGVVGGCGVVGVVYLVSSDHSLVIPITNQKSSISCRIQGQSHFGYLHWDGSSMDRAYLDEIPQMLETMAQEKNYADVKDMAKKAFGASEKTVESVARSSNLSYMYFTTLSHYIEPTEEELEAVYEKFMELLFADEEE